MSEAGKSGITRRGFSGLAAGGVAAAALYTPAKAVAGERRSAHLDLVLFDDRFSDAAGFARAARAEGVSTLATGGDLGALWYAGLREDLGRSVRRLAGMGRHSDFWIMRQLAADRGLSLRFYAEHDFRGRRALTHRLSAGDARLQRDLATGDRPWSAHIARHLARGTAIGAERRQAELASATPAGDDHPGLLVTWVFT